MDKFTINEKEYNALPFTFNLICALDEHGVNMGVLMNPTKIFVIQRAYLAICGNMSLGKAGNEIEQHFIKTGEVDAVYQVMDKQAGDSGFLSKIREMTESLKEQIDKEKKQTKNKKQAEE